MSAPTISTLVWMNDYDTKTDAGPIDGGTVYAALWPARFEMGLRNPVTGRSVMFVQCGIGNRSCWVVVWVNALDLLELRILRVRNKEATELGARSDIDIGSLSKVAVELWCEICTERGW